MTFKSKIFFINGIAIVLVAITGIFAYQRFTDSILQLNENAKTEKELLQLKSFLNEMALAENQVKAYSITKDTTYLQMFYVTAGICQKKWAAILKEKASSSQDSILRGQLGKLVVQKFDIFGKMILLKDLFRVKEAMTKLSERVNLPTLLGGNSNEVTHDNEKKGFLTRLFKKKSEIKHSERETLAKSENSIIEKVNANIALVNEEEKAIADSLRNSELILISANQKLSRKIQSNIEALDNLHERKLEKQSAIARDTLKETNFQIALFCIAVCSLLLLMTYTILRYISYNNRFRKALNKAKAEAEDLALTKDKFFTSVSHEIRTPLNAIIGFAELLSKEKLNKRESEQLLMLQKSADHLLYLINDILDLAKLDAGKLRLESIGFMPIKVLDDTIQLLHPLAKENETEIHIEKKGILPGELIFKGDPNRLKQILLNLISNAIKFTYKGQVKVIVESFSSSKEEILGISILDNGIGMNKKQLKKVFQEFEQADASISRKYGGSGLGLSIVNKLIKLHNGQIKIESNPGVGTAVYIKLPYVRGGMNDLPALKEKDLHQYSIPPNLKILIADDEEYNRKLLVSILSKYQIECFEVNNGAEVLKDLRNNTYDIILMDSRMPKLSGVEAAKKIRSLGTGNARIPIIAISAAVSEADQHEYKNSGMQGFIAKPFKETELINAICKVLPNPKINETTSHTLPEYEIPEKQSETSTKIDLKELRELSNGDNRFYKEMLEIFIDSTNSGLSVIQEAQRNHDLVTIAEYAHKISAPCRHIGASKLYSKLKIIENESRENKNVNIIYPIIEEILAEFKEIENEIKFELQNDN